LQAAPRIDVSTTRVIRLDGKDAQTSLDQLYRQLEVQARNEIGRVGQGGEPQWSRYAQMRYVGQGFEIHVELPDGAIDASYPGKVIEAFRQAYLRKNKFVDEQGIVEGVDWTLVATHARHGNVDIRMAESGAGRGAPVVMRKAWFPEAGGFTDTRVLDRAALSGAAPFAGPVIIDDPYCTIVVPPGDTVHMNDAGHIIIDIDPEGRS
jgi:N-methylhydantoinase A